jgi:hypothetical protein
MDHRSSASSRCRIIIKEPQRSPVFDGFNDWLHDKRFNAYWFVRIAHARDRWRCEYNEECQHRRRMTASWQRVSSELRPLGGDSGRSATAFSSLTNISVVIMFDRNS